QGVRHAKERAPVRLVTLQAVNHETGVVQPVQAVAEIVRAAGARLHVDAVQAVGRLPPSTGASAALVTGGAPKFRGPKGIGAVVTRPGVRIVPLLVGGAQERGARPGTQDAAACAGLAVAARRARDTPRLYEALAVPRDRLEEELVAVGRRAGCA